jgi:hypothetical protein
MSQRKIKKKEQVHVIAKDGRVSVIKLRQWEKMQKVIQLNQMQLRDGSTSIRHNYTKAGYRQMTADEVAAYKEQGCPLKFDKHAMERKKDQDENARLLAQLEAQKAEIAKLKAAQEEPAEEKPEPKKRGAGRPRKEVAK